ncbi:tryptophan--tRNA ligase [Candidatus Dojkabacteria bacterium]|nr:tryptophan--tRNA ligase [Candidatus Dojkabacteria bacterium]
MKPKNIQEQEKLLRELGINDFEFIKHAPMTDVDEYIFEMGLTYDQGLSTLIFKTDKGYIGVYRRDDTKVDINKLKKILNLKQIQPADTEVIKKKFGFDKGTVSIFHEDLEYVMDKALLEKEYVYSGFGDPEWDIKMRPEDLKKLTNPKVVDCSYQYIRGQKRVLSGITPSSPKGLHLGNYFGAVKPQVEFQDRGECFYFVANIHALNTVFNPKEVEKNTMNVFMEWIAFGIDPEKTTFYVQSDIPAIPYLQTILNNVTSIAELKRMHAYKDKLQKEVAQDNISMGLFSYPVLMAADILILEPDLIPVGEDQTQHVEICRDMARNFNKRYGKTLKLPKLYVRKNVARVKGIDGERKMSKSLGNDISIFGEEEKIRQQIMKITTDPARVHPTDPGDPKKNVAFSYLELLEYNNDELKEMKDKYKTGNIGDVEIKEKLYETFMDYFKDVRKKKKELLNNIDYVKDMRIKGAEKANKIADKLFAKIRKAVGLSKAANIDINKEEKAVIGYEDFAKLDIRVGTIKKAEEVESADKLLKLIVDLGKEERQLMAGLAEFYSPEELVGKQIPVLFNLEPKVIRGLESQGMILAADDSGKVVLLNPDKEIESGTKVR